MLAKFIDDDVKCSGQEIKYFLIFFFHLKFFPRLKYVFVKSKHEQIVITCYVLRTKVSITHIICIKYTMLIICTLLIRYLTMTPSTRDT